MNYFSWGHLKNKVYVTPPINVDDLSIRITAKVNIFLTSYEKTNEEHEKKSTARYA